MKIQTITMVKRLEIETAKRSDHVFTITSALKDILIGEEGLQQKKSLFYQTIQKIDKFTITGKDEYFWKSNWILKAKL